MKSELEAVGQVAFPTTYAGNDIWRDDVIHVDGIHSLAFGRVLDALDRLRNGVRVSNLVIQGRPGIGKSHFLGRVRHSVIEQGQIFVLFQRVRRAGSGTVWRLPTWMRCIGKSARTIPSCEPFCTVWA